MAKKNHGWPLTWPTRLTFRSLIAIFTAFLLIAAVYLTQDGRFALENWIGSKTDRAESISDCDYFAGKWVFDNQSYPLYKEEQCTFMSDQLACGKFGREDLSFQQWRWQPDKCDLPRFNATALLERMRNKRMIYVGDSLNRGQWVSMVCLVSADLPTALKSMHSDGSLMIFKAMEYNASIEFYWAPLLVESNSDDPLNHRLPDRIVRVNAIEKHAKHWTDADVLVFNSYLWWRRPKMKVLWGEFEHPAEGIYKEVDMLRVYEMALRTWSDWLEEHVDRNKTQLFFMSMSPTHERGEEWGGGKNQNCYKEMDPIKEERYWGSGSDLRMMDLVEGELKKMRRRGVKVQLLNITQLSDYRKEAHPSIYRKQWETLSEHQIADPASYADCIHWCLPGVSDVWNELLYAFLFLPRWSRKKTQNHSIALIFLLFILCTMLYNERSIRQIDEPPDQGHRPQTSVTYVQPNVINHRKAASGVLDRFSKCNSTKEYSSRKIAWPSSSIGRDSVRGNVSSESCDVFSGKWVFDNVSHPLYQETDCPYMSDQLACHKHGRSDLGYRYWKWQPNDCNLNRWKVAELWEKLRGKRLMFVGDSLNRGQWISLICLLQSVIPADKKSITPNAPLTIFRAEEYNATIEFLWAPLLVESNSDDPVNHRLDERIIRPDSVLKHSEKWENADILVFNTYLWWRQGPVKLLWSSEENGVCEELDGLGAMELAMEAWADWVASKVDPLQKKVFFVTMSPTHLWKREWEPGSEGNCYDERAPIKTEGYWGSGSDLPTMRMLDKILGKLGSKLTVLNITQLSEYRKDGHPSIYRKFWENLSPAQLSNPASYSDCIHWCSPGVQDVWNELLIHHLL